MKKIAILIVLAGIGYFAYDRVLGKNNPAVIEHPVYAEFRVNAKPAGRDITIALVAKMASVEDCEQRADRVWEKVLKSCADCTLGTRQCKSELPPRHAQLFDDVPLHSTYLSFTRGSRFERDGRMVVFGLTGSEGNEVCEMLRKQFATQYSGEVKCIPAIS